jgi:hypothetical protein
LGRRKIIMAIPLWVWVGGAVGGFLLLNKKAGAAAPAGQTPPKVGVKAPFLKALMVQGPYVSTAPVAPTAPVTVPATPAAEITVIPEPGTGGDQRARAYKLSNALVPGSGTALTIITGVLGKLFGQVRWWRTAVTPVTKWEWVSVYLGQEDLVSGTVYDLSTHPPMKAQGYDGRRGTAYPRPKQWVQLDDAGNLLGYAVGFYHTPGYSTAEAAKAKGTALARMSTFPRLKKILLTGTDGVTKTVNLG